MNGLYYCIEIINPFVCVMLRRFYLLSHKIITVPTHFLAIESDAGYMKEIIDLLHRLVEI